MNPEDQKVTQNPFLPCTPEKFAGRFDEKSKLKEILNGARNQGKMALISGARGSGKSSFLEWIKYEIQNKPGGLESPAIKKEFLETTGMIFLTYRDLLTDLKGYQKFGWFKKILDNPKVKNSIEVALDVLEKASPLTGQAKIGLDFGITTAKKMLPEQPSEYSQLLPSFLSVLRNLSEELTNNNRLFAIIVDDVQFSSDSDFILLKDLIRNPLPAIIFIAAFRLEAKKIEMYEELRQELHRFNHTEICLSGMIEKEIKDLANKRFGLSISDETAQFLRINIGDPLC
jgi:AAA15 family ATPase/GTPase